MHIQHTQKYSLLSLQHVSVLPCHPQGVLIGTVYTQTE